jgi:hypothetical protein
MTHFVTVVEHDEHFLAFKMGSVCVFDLLEALFKGAISYL